MRDPVKERVAGADWPRSARGWRQVYLLQRDTALAERAGYAALEVAVQRFAAREARLTRPGRR